LPVEGDERRLSQVMTNLLTNAAKFTPRGGRILVEARREGGEVVLRVTDSGVGIGAEMLPNVFDMFFQARKTFDRSHGGLGLGLAIVRNLVNLHGGSVSASSAGPDLGSQFTIRLPIAGAAPAWVAHETPASAQAHTARAVLIVDDNQDAANTLAEIMTLRGHVVKVAYGATSAIDTVRDWIPDVAFLDLGLPGTSGYELARALRALPGLESLAVYAVSGYGQSHDRKRSADSGFKGHFVKPVSAEQIEAALREPVA
jgi:CheY-like chemotaxis protein